MSRVIPWTDKEWSQLVKTLSKHSPGQLTEAVAEHNRNTGNQRSIDSIQCKAVGMGYPHIRDLMTAKPPTRRLGDIPATKVVDKLVSVLKSKGEHSLAQLCDAMDLSPKRLEDLVRLARSMGVAVNLPDNKTVRLEREAPNPDVTQVHRIPMEPVDEYITFGVTADQHHGSKKHRQECLVDFVDYAYEECGVRDILDCGDVLAGYGVYKGQTFDLIDPSYEGQAKLFLKSLPAKKGLKWRIIGGNHDESWFKLGGADILQRIGESQREDVFTYGYYTALIDLKPEGRKYGIKAEMHHMAKAGGYALSYHLQKCIEQIPPGMKPQLLFCGHPHVAFEIPDYRGIAGYVCGCFEDQTMLLKRLHVNPAICGLIIRVGITKSGMAKTLQHTWVKYSHSRRGPIVCRDGDNEVRFERSIGLPTDV